MTDLKSDWEDFSVPDALSEITAASEGLLVPSESDYPLEPFRWPAAEPPQPEDLLAHFEMPPDTPVETRSLEAFLQPLADERDWFDDEQRAAAQRFAALHNLIADRLQDVTVYRLGERQIKVLLLGRDSEHGWVGLETTVIET